MNLLIVNFHYYSNLKFPQGIYPVTPDFFAKQLAVIARKYKFISQLDLVNCFTEGNFPAGNYCIITFDDGLKEQVRAFQWLKEHNIPAIFYIPVMPLKDNKALYVHKLHQIRANRSDEYLLDYIKVSYDYVFTESDFFSAKDQYKYDNQVARELKYLLNFKLKENLKKDFIENLFTEIYPDELEFVRSFYMNEEELKLIAEFDMLGSHGYSHIPLSSAIDPSNEISTSLDFLENLAQKPIISFSYPYGSKAAVNENISKFFKNTNVKFGLTMMRGINCISSNSNPYLLLRIDTNDAPGGQSPQYFENTNCRD